MELYLFYLALGALAGTVGGLFGVGGGVVVVPALILAFTSQGMSSEVLTHMAVATSLAAMVVTATASAWAHHTHGSVRWSVFRWLALGVFFGAFIGVAGSLQLRGEWIQIAFGLFLLVVGARVLMSSNTSTDQLSPKPLTLSLVGAVIGSVSMVFGIGGGSMTVPFLLHCQFQPRFAIGTSAALGFPIALFGAALYAFQSGGDQLLPEYALGYVYLPAFIGMAVTGIPFARLGANVAQKLPEHRLKQAFAIFALSMAVFLLTRNLI